MPKQRKKLGELLVEWGVVRPNDLSDALDYAKANSKRIGQALVELGHATEDHVAKALAAQFDMEYVDLEAGLITPGAMELLPEELVRRHNVLPLTQADGRLKVIISDPLDLETLDVLRFRTNLEVETLIASREKIRKFIDQYLAPGGLSIDKTVQEMRNEPGVETGLDAEDEDVDSDSAPIIRLLNLIISEAVRTRASDVHIEPMADRVRVRYRIDGVCVERDQIPKRMQGPVTARLKIMSGMKIEEKRVPQDGRIKLNVAGEAIDFRVSALPGYHGESIVLRILRPDSVKIGIKNLGFEDDDYQRFSQIIKRPNGIFLVTGPTGSGKTTTLYGALQELNRPDRKIITAEDPVEYNFAGINQCQVREGIGLSFARILRAMLRQAPNIILVGEIRDLEVAEVAIQAALTGHLVFSTLHTNDAPSAITRLIDMGVKPFLVASSIQAIMAQRLIRVLCPECKAPDTTPDRFKLRVLGFDPKQVQGKTFYKAVGCPKCNNTGYRGRLGIFEMMVMNNQIRELAFRRAPTNEVRAAAIASGMRNLLADGRLKILNGTTTLDEVSRMTQAEGLVAAAEPEAATEPETAV
ncbi:MAG: Type II secretion system protein E [Phycisphaerae bacterium]|nr:Type II secretion system protein E [Phycisphaerae bacterium]